MTHDEYFLDTLDDLEARSQLGRGEYDALMMAAILRRLFIDDSPLVDTINRREGRRLQLKFRMSARTRSARRPPESGCVRPSATSRPAASAGACGEPNAYAASTCSSPTNGDSSSSSNGTTSRTRNRWPAPSRISSPGWIIIA